MDISRLYQIINNKREINRIEQPELEAIIQEYPYFQAGVFAYLSCLYQYNHSAFREALSSNSIFISDRKALFYYILKDEYKLFFEKTGKKELKEDKTSVLLNAFFESEGIEEDDDKFFTNNVLHIGLASSDYFSYLKKAELEISVEGEDDAISAKFKHQDIIDSYIEKSEHEGNAIRLNLQVEENEYFQTEATPENVKDEDLDDEMFFTETLSKIYIRQKKYEKAYKIIKHLSLNYPKKNAYFADQLNFLEKLIINSNKKNIK